MLIPICMCKSISACINAEAESFAYGHCLLQVHKDTNINKYLLCKGFLRVYKICNRNLNSLCKILVWFCHKDKVGISFPHPLQSTAVSWV